MQLTPIEKLDSVLKYLAAANQPPKRTHAEMVDEFPNKGIDVDSKQLFEILHKLQLDNNCYIEYNGNNIAHYWSTFDGHQLSINGGYEQLIIKTKERGRNKEIQDWLLTAGSILAAIAGFLLFGMEVYKKI